jgi:hypothetical protein
MKASARSCVLVSFLAIVVGACSGTDTGGSGGGSSGNNDDDDGFDPSSGSGNSSSSDSGAGAGSGSGGSGGSGGSSTSSTGSGTPSSSSTGGGNDCASLGTWTACEECECAKNEAGCDAYWEAEDASCYCGAGAACGEACAASYCSDDTQWDEACNTCAEALDDTCFEAASATCEGDPACAAYMEASEISCADLPDDET